MTKRFIFQWVAILIVSLVSSIVYGLRADINKDGKVDLLDLAILASEWMQKDEGYHMGLGPELVTNGMFADGWTGWSDVNGADGFQLVGETMEYIGNDTAGTLKQTLAISSGKTVQVSFTAFEADENTIPDDTCQFVFYTSTDQQCGNISITEFGEYSEEITLTEDVSYFVFDAYASNETAGIGIDNVAIKEVLGFTPVSANRANNLIGVE